MSESINPAKPPLARPDDIIDGIAADAWQAYNAMETTKRRHYELLEILDNKKKNYNLDPSDAERLRLAGLLKDHDEQVKRFTAASSELKQRDQQAHISLFTYIGAISRVEDDTSVRH